MQNTSPYLDLYARRNHKKVSGWLRPETIPQLIRINHVQHELGILGHVGEIGVHHGKLFILLYLLAREGEQAVAIDLFEQQELNVDKSGHGSLQILKENLAGYAGGTSKLKIIQADSTTLNAEEIKATAGGCLRLFSIDGGHLAPIVRQDLNTAAAAICSGGVIILDDYFNPGFPGVSEGVNQFFLLDNERKLVPFLVAINKIYLTTSDYAEHYIDYFTRADLGTPYASTIKFCTYNTSSAPIRITKMFGAEVLSYSPDRFSMAYRATRLISQQQRRLRKQLSDSEMGQRLRNTGLGHLIRRFADKVIPY